MVAKTYQSFPQLGEPFLVNGRLYIKVRNPRTGVEKDVRFYSEKEYQRMYKEPTIFPDPRTYMKKILGFEKEYITIFPDIDLEDPVFCHSNARYHGTWGWYVVSTEEVPKKLGKGLTLYWKDVATADGLLKDRQLIKDLIAELKTLN